MDHKPTQIISKSKFVAGCQCLKRLYWQVHEPELAEALALGLLPQIQPERFILLQTKSGKHYITVPTVGVPDAVRYQELEDEISRHPKRSSDIILLYDERGIRDKWMKHLDWLDRQTLPVKSLQVAKAQSWLGGLT